jgi:hypothetical protein
VFFLIETTSNVSPEPVDGVCAKRLDAATAMTNALSFATGMI